MSSHMIIVLVPVAAVVGDIIGVVVIGVAGTVGGGENCSCEGMCRGEVEEVCCCCVWIVMMWMGT